MNDYRTLLAGLRDLVDNPSPRVPVVLCLDTSGSMNGEPICELNAAVEQFIQELTQDDMTRLSAETAIVTFDDKANCISDFRTADNMTAPRLQTGGLTDLGSGLTLALELLEQRKKQYKTTGTDYYQPILVVMSDGAPNGNRMKQDEAVNRLRELVENRKLTVIPVGIGEEADMRMLTSLSPKRRAVRLRGLQFREFFAWLSRSVAEVTTALPEDEVLFDEEALRALEAEPWPQNIT